MCWIGFVPSLVTAHSRSLFGGVELDMVPATPGVPEWSFLGPILLFVYNNGLPKYVASRARVSLC